VVILFFIFSFFFFSFVHIHTLLYILKWGKKKKAPSNNFNTILYISPPDSNQNQIIISFKILFPTLNINSLKYFLIPPVQYISFSFLYFFNLNLDSLRKVRNPITWSTKTRIHFIWPFSFPLETQNISNFTLSFCTIFSSIYFFLSKLIIFSDKISAHQFYFSSFIRSY